MFFNVAFIPPGLVVPRGGVGYDVTSCLPVGPVFFPGCGGGMGVLPTRGGWRVCCPLGGGGCASPVSTE